MEVSQKLLIYGIIAFVGLLMQVVIFTSPGWTHVHIPVRKPNEKPLPWCHEMDPVVTENGKPVPRPPCIPIEDGHVDLIQDDAASSEDKGDDNDSAEKHEHKHHGPHVSVSLGLWYLVTCSHVSKSGEHEKQCRVSSYDQISEVVSHFPTETYGLGGMVSNIGKYSNKMMFEFRAEVTIAMLSSFFGIIGLLVYARGGAKGRHSAILTFISLLVSGVVTFVSIGKVASILMMAKSYLKQDPDMAILHVHIGFPWCLVVALGSAVLTLIATFGILLVLSRGYNPKDFPRPYEIEDEGSYKRFSNGPCTETMAQKA